MNHSEREYITQCKRLIEEKFQFEKDRGTLRQRELEYLADIIEEKSGIKLSLSTLKRLWKTDYDQTPHPSTLQALVSVLGYNDWHEFKKQQILVPPIPAIAQQKSFNRLFKSWMVLPIVAVSGVLFWLIAFRSKPSKIKPVVKGPVIFTGNKTVSQGVPSTVVFNYDVSNVDADSFFFQQSWNNQEKIKLDPKGHYYSNIYYYPGFHKAKLIANDSILKRFIVHVTTDGWMPLVRSSSMDNIPRYLRKHQYISSGTLHVSRNDLSSSNVNIDKSVPLSYYNVRDYNTASDNFSLDTRILCDSSQGVGCPGVELVIMCEVHIFFVRLMGKGCERDIAIKMGEVYRDGVQNDLSALGRDLHHWQRLQIRVVDKKATIYLEEQPVNSIEFKNDFGKVVGLAYHFTGTGAIDYVKLKNGENKTVYDEEFEN